MGGFLVFAVGLGGCKVGPNYQQPQVAVPAAYHEGLSAGTNQAPQELAQWWRIFHDRELDRLIEEATVANHDVRIAEARVREVRAQAGVTRSALFPSVNANGDYSRLRLSEHTPDAFVAQAAGQSLEQNFYHAGFDMNWELDIFGGNRRALEAANANVGASEEARRGVLISVIAEVGLNYLDLRGLQKQLAVARDNLSLQEQTWL